LKHFATPCPAGPVFAKPQDPAAFAKAFEARFRSSPLRVWEAFDEVLALLFAGALLLDPRAATEGLAESTVRDAERAKERLAKAGLPPAEVIALVQSFVEAIAADGNDWLGRVAGLLSVLDGTGKGQIFTPPGLASLMAALVDHGAAPSEGLIRETVRRDGCFTVLDPAAGSGSLLLAMAERVRDAGLDPALTLYVEAVDIDTSAARMAFVQLSIRDVPAKVICGDSLSRETRWEAYTPITAARFIPFQQERAKWKAALRFFQ
jgi:N-6 DNA Methylase